MNSRTRARRAPRHHRHRPGPARRRAFEQLEDRTLLSSVSLDDLASAPLLGAAMDSRTGSIGPGAPAFFQINAATDAHLVARVHAPGITTRLVLLDVQGSVLVQSDG